MADFYEMRFPVDIEYGFTGGPKHNTGKTITESGFVQSIISWREPLRNYQISDADQTDAKRKILLNFLYQVYGPGIGFRFKDWNDYIADATEGIANEDAIVLGQNTFQLYKKYVYDANYPAFTREIKKPCNNSTFKPYLNGVLQVGWTIDFTSGIVTMTPLVSKTVTAITKANPGVVTATGHTYTTGEKIRFKTINGMTQLNNNLYTITVINPNTFSIGVDTTSYGTFVNDGLGKAEKFAQGADSVTWEGEFDVPVEFAEDYNEFRNETFNKTSFQPRLIEQRLI